MKTREVSVIGRTVYGNGEVELIRTSVGIDQMHVLFDSAEWVAFGAVSVTFKNSADTENPITTSITPTAIDSPDWSAEATCLIPWEVIQDVGAIAVTFQATDSSSNHIITARAESVLSVIEAGDVNEGTVPSTAPTLSEWEQAYADAMAAASSAADAAEQISDILGSTDAQTLEELIAALGSALRYKGSVSTYADLPEDAEQGDTYNVTTAYGDYPAGTNWAWTGTQWDALGGEIDLSQFATKDTATTSADGLMSATDKAKLDGVEAGANNYTLPTMDADTRGGAALGTGLRVDEGSLSLGNLVTDSCDGPIYSVDAEGWSEQASTTGKNLIPFPYYSIAGTSNGVTAAIGAYGRLTFTGRSSDGYNFFLKQGVQLPAGTYTISVSSAMSGMSFRVYDGVSTVFASIEGGNTSASFTLTEDKLVTIYFNVSGANIDVSFDGYPQLEAGSTATSYEPYTGGAPSPSPDYPQEIKVARGRNLLNPTNETISFTGDNTMNFGSVKLESGTTYTFSCMQDGAFTSVGRNTIRVQSPTSVNTYESGNENYHLSAGRHTFTFTASESGTYMFGVWVQTPSNNMSYSEPQLELGSQSTPYVSYNHVGLEVGITRPFEVEIGSFNTTGDNITSTIRMRNVGYVDVNAGDVYMISGISSQMLQYYVLYFDSKGMETTGNTGWMSTPSFFTVPSGCNYVRILFRHSDDSSISSISGLQFKQIYAIPIPLPSKGWAGGLPDGTADALSVDSAGRWAWECLTDEKVATSCSSVAIDSGVYQACVLLGTNLSDVITIQDGASLCSHYMQTTSWTPATNGILIRKGAVYFEEKNSSKTTKSDWNTWLTANPVTVLYPLATPTTEHGYVDLPMDIPEGSTITIPELENTNVRCFVHGAAELAIHAANWGKRAAENESRIAALEAQIAEIATA